MKDDFVRRQDVIDAFDLPIYNIKGKENAEKVVEYLRAVIQRIKDLPSAGFKQFQTAQPEIIRCKECLIHGVCRFEQGLGLDGYCSQAERRTDE